MTILSFIRKNSLFIFIVLAFIELLIIGLRIRVRLEYANRLGVEHLQGVRLRFLDSLILKTAHFVGVSDVYLNLKYESFILVILISFIRGIQELMYSFNPGSIKTHGITNFIQSLIFLTIMSNYNTLIVGTYKNLLKKVGANIKLKNAYNVSVF